MHAVASHSRIAHSKKKLLQVQQTLQTKIETTLHVDPEHVSESIETESAEDVITKARDMDILIEKIKEKMTIANRNQKIQLLTLIPLSYKDIQTEFNVTKHMVKRFTIEVHAPLLSYKGIGHLKRYVQDSFTNLLLKVNTPTTVTGRKYNIRKKSEVEEELLAMSGADTDIKLPARKRSSDPAKRKPKLKIAEEKVKSFTAHNQDHSLLKFLSTIANTAGERFEVLKARDNLIRLQKKQMSRSRSKTLSGTCPDMCPEKERYDRQEKKQLSIFELHSSSQHGENIVDHTLAIKEYSRSSADQEEPLPFELRPTSVLCMTMDYLICNLMDYLESQSNVRIGDWFDFLWNRTRAIRKDITQQHLCNLKVVALIEKCARFHIYCAERLCEESMMNFDPRINNENLTKCMQTLKHFYYDLGIKGIKCPCEAEFRAYDILLNLNRGDILREVQQLSPEVRKSSHVNFALNVLSAFNSQNYARFFKLLYRGSFLHSCILHRYFTEVRTKALYIIVKAYCPSNHSTVQHPLEDLVVRLGFENEEEATSFCFHHGLTTTESIINLNRNSFFYPESAPSMLRAKILIESKIRTSVGEIVNGGPLPENIKLTYSPHNSFESNGLLKKLAFDASDQINHSSVVPEDALKSPPFHHPTIQNLPKAVQPVLAKKNLEPIMTDILDAVLNDLLFDTVDEMILYNCHNILIHMQNEFKLIQSQSQIVLSDLIDDIIRRGHFVRNFVFGPEKGVLLRNVGSEYFHGLLMEMKREKEIEEMERKESQLRIETVSSDIIDELIFTTVQDETRRIVSSNILEIKNLRALQCKERCTITIQDDIIDETTDAFIKEISSDMHLQLVIVVKKKLKEFREKRSHRVMKKYFKIWQHRHFLHTRLKKASETFPGGFSLLSIKTQSELLGKDMKIVPINEISIAKAGNDSLDLCCLEKFIALEIKSFPLNVPSIIQEKVPVILNNAIPGSTCFWKLAISLPSDENQKELCSWIKKKFTRGKPIRHKYFEEIETLTLMTTDLVKPSSNYIKLGTCIKSMTGTVKEDISSEFLFHGTLGVFIFMVFDLNSYSYVLDDAHNRLECILKSKPANPSLPVLLIALGHNIPADGLIMTELNIESLRNEQYISEVNIIRGSDDFAQPASTQLLIDAISWIGDHCPVITKVLSSSVSDFVENYVFQIPLRMICIDKERRHKLNLTQQDPNTTIDLLNHAIMHMTKIKNVGSGFNISWPPAEFCDNNETLPPKDWSSEKSAWCIPNFLKNLKLADIQAVYSWNEAIDEIREFIDNLKFENTDNADLITRTEYLLRKTLSKLDYDDIMEIDENECDGIELIPWSDIVLAFVDYMARHISYVSNELPQLFFVPNDIISMKAPAFWLNATSVSTYHHDCITESMLKRKLSLSVEEPPKAKYKLQVSNLQQDAEEKIKIMIASLQQEKFHRSIFQEKLDKANDDSFDCESETAVTCEDGENICEEEDPKNHSFDDMILKIKKLVADNKKKSLEFDDKLAKYSEN
ncbi:Germinal-center associated nuclear protein [Nymphon striatum]|nr:Germinal-center associated nuclear protein [Nymphon striatum]